MYGSMIYPVYPPLPSYTIFPKIQHLPRSPYPKVDTKVFQNSIKSFRYLMEQGGLLLDQLGDSSFAYKIMDAAQLGKKVQVENLIKSIGLKVPVTTKYNPSGVIFILHSQVPQQTSIDCCTLTISMRWGI
ncbi:MAG: hypothetical protein Q8934_22695 [Bacillota bacterium]|nr:hypothetical protein [Bacillota bacterium]